MRVVVTGIRGGLGVSTISALLAQQLTTIGSVALVEASGSDSLDLLLGLEHVAGLRWAAIRSETPGSTNPGWNPDAGPDQVAGNTPRRDPDHADSVWSLPTWAGVDVLGGASPADLASDIGRDVLAALATRKTIVLDGGIGDFDIPGAQRIVVVGTDVVSVTKAREGLTGHGSILVVRRVRYAALSPLEISDVLGTPVVAVISDDQSLGRSVEAGLGPVPNRITRRSISRLAQYFLDLAGHE